VVCLSEEYGSRWVDCQLIPIGGQWCYCVGIVQDIRTNELKVRVAKGKVKGYVRRNPDGKLEVFPNDPKNPISQINRLNIKDFSEWEMLTVAVKEWCEKLKAQTLR